MMCPHCNQEVELALMKSVPDKCVFSTISVPQKTVQNEKLTWEEALPKTMAKAKEAYERELKESDKEMEEAFYHTDAKDKLNEQGGQNG